MILIVLLNNPLYMGSDMVLETRILGLVHADHADYVLETRILGLDFRNEDLRILGLRGFLI